MLQDKPFGDRAFHGDEYLLKLVDYLMPHCIYFETGVHRGDTFAYVAHNYSSQFAVGCEPNENYLREAEAKVRGLINVETFQVTSQEFQVPGKPQFTYDISTGRECSYQTIKQHIKNGYQAYYPAYTERTSKTMNLVGWGLLVKDWEVPEELKDILC